MTYKELNDRLSKCQLTLEKIKDGTYTPSKSQNIAKTAKNLELLKESLIKQLKEAEKGMIHTDDEAKAKDLADDGANVKLTKEQDGMKFSVDETKAIAKSVGKAVAMSVKSLGDEIGSMKATKIEENSFDIDITYKNDNEDSFSFYITDDTLHLTDFSFDKELTDVGVKPSGEAQVNVDHLANELTKHFKSQNEVVNADDTKGLKKLSKALSNSVKAHQDQKKKLDKLINTEGEVSEAPEGMYYIKIPKDAASQNKAQVIFNDIYGIAYEINDDPDGIVMYFKKDDFNPGLLDDLEGDMVQILDTNIPMSEGEKETDDYGRPHVDPKGSRTFLEPDEMLPHNRFKKMAQKEDKDIGHVDDEPDMLQATAYEIATYAAKLSKKLAKYDAHDGEVDFPNWWQAKLILAKDYMSKAYHYLDSEEKQPALDQLALENFIKEGRGDGEAINNIIINMANEDGISTGEAAQEIIDHITHIFIDTKGTDEGKYKSDAQRKAIYATKAEKEGVNEVDEDRFVRAAFEDLEQVIRNLAHTANISEDEALEMAIRKLEAMLDGRDDMEEGRNVDDLYDTTVHTMKRLAKKYKAGDKSVVPHLKKLTDIKKKLEQEKIKKASNIGKDQELDEAGPGFKHDCAAKVIHKEHGAGNTIPEKHTLVKEGDKYVVTHYDVLFENGNTVLDIPVNELKIETTNEHWHKGYKKKKK